MSNLKRWFENLTDEWDLNNMSPADEKKLKRAIEKVLQEGN